MSFQIVKRILNLCCVKFRIYHVIILFLINDKYDKHEVSIFFYLQQNNNVMAFTQIII